MEYLLYSAFGNLPRLQKKLKRQIILEAEVTNDRDPTVSSKENPQKANNNYVITAEPNSESNTKNQWNDKELSVVGKQL
jgi:hypothetical protein